MLLNDFAFRPFWLTAKDVWICSRFPRARGCKRACNLTTGLFRVCVAFRQEEERRPGRHLAGLGRHLAMCQKSCAVFFGLAAWFPPLTAHSSHLPAADDCGRPVNEATVPTRRNNISEGRRRFPECSPKTRLDFTLFPVKSPL